MQLVDHNEMVRGYISAAIFTNCENGEPGQFEESELYRKLYKRVPAAYHRKVSDDCFNFRLGVATELLSDYLQSGKTSWDAGSDLYFSRNGHGVGFFDGDFNELQELAEAMKSDDHVSTGRQGNPTYDI